MKSRGVIKIYKANRRKCGSERGCVSSWRWPSKDSRFRSDPKLITVRLGVNDAGAITAITVYMADRKAARGTCYVINGSRYSSFSPYTVATFPPPPLESQVQLKTRRFGALTGAIAIAFCMNIKPVKV
jgi:hypothetical protein